jgi:ubiquinone/menaquinone biosynthesis C-methylase UbiE
MCVPSGRWTLEGDRKTEVTVTETFSLSLDQAHAYEQLFVPALFAQWVPTLLECAKVAAGQRVLDVACGTGVAARGAAAAVGPAGHVSGVDLNPAMIQVARECAPGIEWRVGDASKLPYEDEAFDAVLCQSALFFFPDSASAVREMSRVLVLGGTVAVQTYAELEEQPGYRPFVDTVVRHAGPDARSLLGTYWSKGRLDELRALFADAGLEVTEARTLLGTVTFPSVDALVQTEIRATPLAERIDEVAYGAISENVRKVLERYADAEGMVRLPIRARFIAGVK